MSQLRLAHLDDHDDNNAPRATVRAGRRALILVGNPNVGKSLLFGALTNRYVTVSNYPGTTVEITRAAATVAGEPREVIDTPGTSGLIPQSEDERVTRDILLAKPDADVVQVGDLKNLRRTLLLALQIVEYGMPFTLCLNMADEAQERAIEVDAGALATALGVAVVPTSALRRWNLDKLQRAAVAPRHGRAAVQYSAPIEEGIARVIDLLDGAGTKQISKPTRGLALAVLAGDTTLVSHLKSHYAKDVLRSLDTVRQEIEGRVSEPLAYAISRERLGAVDEIMASVFHAPALSPGGIRDWLGRISVHPVWGVPFLGLVLYAAWLFVGKIGAGTLVDFVQNRIFVAHINPWTIRLLDMLMRFPHHHLLTDGVIAPEYAVTAKLTSMEMGAKFLHDLVAGPYGVVTMALTYAIAIVLPVVATFFIFFGILEDSGYLPRLAVMLNRVFRLMGLNGKAVLPMVLGLGCDTMATLTTRILETKKEATIVTILLALGVPCSAQLGVIMAMLGPLHPAATILWLGVVGGTIFIVGLLASKVLPGESGDFILEVPPVRVPKLTNILIKVAARTEWYLKEAVPLFIVGTLVLYLADLTKLLGKFQSLIAPLVVGGLGLPREAANAFLIGFLRRDYGAAGLFAMQKAGALNPVQTVVSLTVITLFVPCVANFLVILKERGMRAGLAMTGFIIVYAFGIGVIMNYVLRGLGVSFS
ncbi:MAG TPA: ferrous iron transport protein B [Thermoanaerobaculia bacterium]|nr:ferrous iron transport protein B [Thermoanaerobaculia bacterium]